MTYDADLQNVFMRPDNYEKTIGFEALCALKTVRTALPRISIIRIS